MRAYQDTAPQGGMRRFYAVPPLKTSLTPNVYLAGSLSLSLDVASSRLRLGMDLAACSVLHSISKGGGGERGAENRLGRNVFPGGRRYETVSHPWKERYVAVGGGVFGRLGVHCHWVFTRR